MEKKKHIIPRIIKKLFLIFNFIFSFGRGIKKAPIVGELSQNLYQGEVKVKEVRNHVFRKDLKISIQVLVFSRKKFSFSRNEICNILLFQTFWLFFALFFLSEIIFIFFLMGPLPKDPLLKFVKIFCLIILFFFISFFEFLYFFSRCNLLTHSNSLWTVFSFINFFIFITTTYYRNTNSRFNPKNLIEKLFVFEPFAPYRLVVFEPFDPNIKTCLYRIVLVGQVVEQDIQEVVQQDIQEVVQYIATNPNTKNAPDSFWGPFTGYMGTNPQIETFHIIVVLNPFSQDEEIYNPQGYVSFKSQGIIFFCFFFFGVIAEIYFFSKEIKINRLWIPLSDLLMLSTVCCSVFFCTEKNEFEVEKKEFEVKKKEVIKTTLS